MAVFCRSRISISRQQRFPRRRTTASSVATSIGVHSCSPAIHTSGDSDQLGQRREHCLGLVGRDERARRLTAAGHRNQPSGPSARSFSTCTVVVRTTGKLYCSTEPALLRHATHGLLGGRHDGVFDRGDSVDLDRQRVGPGEVARVEDEEHRTLSERRSSSGAVIVSAERAVTVALTVPESGRGASVRRALPRG